MTSLKLTTPAGRCEWPKLTKPDCYKPKHDGTDVYKYSVKMVFDPTDNRWAKFLEDLDMLAQEAWNSFMTTQKKKRKAPEPLYGLHDQLDDEGNETGMKTLTFYAWGRWTKDGVEKTRKLPMFDKNNQAFEPEGELGSGTVLKVSFGFKGYVSGSNAGVSLPLRAVKIISPEYFGGGGGNDFADDETTEEDFEVAGQSMGSDDGDY